MIVTYDTEFLDDGFRIHLISFGMVAEDGRELYAVNGGAPWWDIAQQPWLMENVVSHLPGKVKRGPTGDDVFVPNPYHRYVMSRLNIAYQVEKFLAETPDPDLWADYPATDHVAGYQLFGSMIEASRDHGWPMRTSCLKQGYEDRKRWARSWPDIHTCPVQDPATEHHALHDARYDMALARWLGLTVDPHDH